VAPLYALRKSQTEASRLPSVTSGVAHPTTPPAGDLPCYTKPRCTWRYIHIRCSRSLISSLMHGLPCTNAFITQLMAAWS
jgi:hypothetical protein